MKVLFIGGTGNISTASSQLATNQGVELYLLNRGSSKTDIPGAKTIIGDINRPNELLELDKLIYGDDIIHESSHVQSIEELTGSVENIRTVFEFRSWIFLKGSYPKICDDVMNEDKTLLSWYNKWEDEIKKFEKLYVVSLE